MFHTLIFAAGKGSRMQAQYDLPKPLLPVKNKPAVKNIMDTLEHLDIDFRFLSNIRKIVFEEYLEIHIIILNKVMIMEQGLHFDTALRHFKIRHLIIYLLLIVMIVLF